MLALQRTIKQEVWVSGPCIIRIEKVTGFNSVRLSFQAPDSTKILRTELLNKEQALEAMECIKT